jgi:hypothetical protein
MVPPEIVVSVVPFVDQYVCMVVEVMRQFRPEYPVGVFTPKPQIVPLFVEVGYIHAWKVKSWVPSKNELLMMFR